MQISGGIPFPSWTIGLCFITFIILYIIIIIRAAVRRENSQHTSGCVFQLCEPGYSHGKQQLYWLLILVSSCRRKHLRKLTKQESQLSGQPHSEKTPQLSLMVTWQWGLMVWGHGGNLGLRESPKVGSCICYRSISLLVWLCYSVYLHLAPWTTCIINSLTLRIIVQLSKASCCRWSLSFVDGLS